MVFEIIGRYENMRLEIYIFFKFDGDVGWWMGENRVIIFFYFDIIMYIFKLCKKDRIVCYFVIGELDIVNLYCSCLSKFVKLGLLKLLIIWLICYLILNFIDKCWFFVVFYMIMIF